MDNGHVIQWLKSTARKEFGFKTLDEIKIHLETSAANIYKAGNE